MPPSRAPHSRRSSSPAATPRGGAARAATAIGVVVLTVAAGLAAAPPASAAAGQLGDVTSFTADGDRYTFGSGEAVLQVEVTTADTLRIRLAPDGELTDPANTDPTDPDAPDADIVVGDTSPRAGSSWQETEDAYLIETDEATLRVNRSPLTLQLSEADGTVVMAETAPLAWDSGGTTQSLQRGEQEQFFGGGMQNGSFSHRDETIAITRDYNWNEGGNPNAVPFYVSSSGYGVLRNTFAPGSYDFGPTVRTTHEEERFDAWYFVGDAREAIDGYTELTGRPSLIPMYGMELGDADCYLHNANRGERETLRDARAVAEGYAEHDMPLGWTLVNDGYGCGYEDLPETGEALDDLGSEMGLWTESDLTEQEYEVDSGVRVRKTDVAWVGPGYRFALDACEQSAEGIEDNSSDRAMVVTIEGWAGTQRCGTVWSGDQAGSWDYIRWQIPTYAGTTMSGQPVSTGDVDGIFGGSAETYVRDLQWKAFLPMTYAMNGWASSDKQPWRYGEPYTSINRDYLQLHEQLLPYLYTHLADASENGVGPTRPLYLNYPTDPKTWGEDVQYQFMAGDDFLIAPVYSDTDTRDGIYLPEGRWVDYWTGRVYEGEQTLEGYSAPLDTLPVFVRAGAVVPMFPEGTLDWQQGKDSGQLDLDVYPEGESSFDLYEDDGRSQASRDGASARQQLTVNAPERRRGTVEIGIGELAGDYAGKPTERHYALSVHTDTRPGSVRLDGEQLPQLGSATAVEEADAGWFHDTVSGITHVKTPSLSTASSATVQLTGSSSVGGIDPRQRNASVEVVTPAISTPGEAQPVTAAFTNQTGRPVTLTALELGLPEGWEAEPESPVTGPVAAGDTVTATFQVSPPADAEPGSVTVSATASYRVRATELQVRDQGSTTLAYADLAAAADNVGVTTADDTAPGNLDGGGNSLPAEQLAEQGLTPGAEVEVNGLDFTWPAAEPGTPDNVAAAGQTVRLEGQGNVVGLLATGSSLSAEGSATVYYTDGSSSTATVGVPNWCCAATDSYGAEIAYTTQGRHTQTGLANQNTAYQLFTTTLPVDETKTVAAVTLPGNPAIHVFAMTVGTKEIAPPPVPDGQYALPNVGTQTRLAAPGATNAGQLLTAAESTSPTQKWNLQRAADGSYELRNAGSGLCADVAGSSTEDGAEVVQYTCTGTPNQRWEISAADGELAIANANSGLLLSVGPDGLVVQADPTGAPEQRWMAVAS